MCPSSCMKLQAARGRAWCIIDDRGAGLMKQKLRYGEKLMIKGHKDHQNTQCSTFRAFISTHNCIAMISTASHTK